MWGEVVAVVEQSVFSHAPHSADCAAGDAHFVDKSVLTARHAPERSTSL